MIYFPLSSFRHQTGDCSSEIEQNQVFDTILVRVLIGLTPLAAYSFLFLGCDSPGISVTAPQVFVSLLKPERLQKIQFDLQGFSI